MRTLPAILSLQLLGIAGGKALWMKPTNTPVDGPVSVSVMVSLSPLLVVMVVTTVSANNGFLFWS